jgi:hypothetical protein
MTLASVRDLALAQWPSPVGGFIVFVCGELLRDKRHHNPRVFVTQEGALAAGKRARK